MKGFICKNIGFVIRCVFSFKNAFNLLFSFLLLFISIFVQISNSEARDQYGRPVVAITNQIVGVNSIKNISNYVKAEDNEVFTKYKINDRNGFNGIIADSKSNFMVNSTQILENVDVTGAGYIFPSSELSTLSVVGDDNPNSQTLQIAGYDGTVWGDWTNFTLKTQVNNLPTVSVTVPSTLTPNKWYRDGTNGFAITTTDDDGDTISKYQIKTSSSGHMFYARTTGYFTPNGTVELDANDFSLLHVRGYASSLEQTVSIRAYDGIGWSDWTDFTLKTQAANNLPTVSVTVPSTLTPNKWYRDGTNGFAITTTDDDGDTISKYQIKTSSSGHMFYARTTGYFTPNGTVELDANDFSLLHVRGYASSLEQTVSIRAYDGIGWSDWTDFTLKTQAANNLPTVSVTVPSTLTPNKWYRDGTNGFAITTTDDDGDTISKYQIKTSSSGHMFYARTTGYFTPNGTVELDANDFSLLHVRGYASSLEQTVSIRAYDGIGWSDWTDFTLKTQAANNLPTVSVTVPSTLTPNKWYRDGTNGFAITTTDDDGDTISKYQIKTSSSGHMFYARTTGYFTPNGTVELDANDFSLLHVRGYASSLEQTVSIRAYDGTGWSDWTDFTLKTQAANNLPTVSVTVPSTLTPNKWYRDGTNGFAITTTDDDGDTISKYQIKTSSSGHMFYARTTGYFTPNGTVELDANDFSLLHVRGYASSLEQTVSIRAYDGIGWSDWTDFTLKTQAANNLPTVSVTVPSTLTPNKWYRDGTNGFAITTTDDDGDTISKYQIKTSSSGHMFYARTTGYFTPNGTVELDANDFSLLHVRGYASSLEQTVSIRAYDGIGWSDWTDFTLKTQAANNLPTVSVTVPSTLTPNKWYRDGTNGFAITTTDDDGDTISKYQIKTSSSGHMFYARTTGYFTPNGTVELDANDFSLLHVRGYASSLEQTVSIRAYDGTGWSDWTDFTLKTQAANNLPTVSVTVPSTLTPNKWYRDGTNGFAITTTDDDGDTISKYQIKTSSSGHMFYARTTGYFTPNGTVELDANDFSLLHVRGYASSLEQTVSIRAYDGIGWSDWTDFTLKTQAANNLPTVSVTVPSTLTPNKWYRDGTNGFAITTTDDDGDTISKYQIKTSSSGHMFYARTTGYFTPNGTVELDANDFSLLHVRGYASSLEQTVSIRAYDGIGWSDWTDFTLKTQAANNLPTVSVTVPSTLTPNKWYRDGTNGFAITTTDDDGDTISKYQIKTSSSGHMFYARTTGYFTPNGTVELDANDFSLLHVRGYASSLEQTVSIRAYDGTGWSDWTDFTLKTQAAANNLPVITISDQTVIKGNRIIISGAINVTDDDGDTITEYRVRDTSRPNGKTRDNFYVNGSTRDASGSNGYQFNSSALSTLSLVGDLCPSIQTLQIKAYDGTAWGNWKNFTLTTTGPDCKVDVDLSHALSQGITGFTYDKTIETSLETDTEFQNTGTPFELGSTYTKKTPLENHNFHKAWAYGLDGEGLTAHVVDGGFNPNHPQFNGKLIEAIGGWSSADGTSITNDHGLVVMGIIGANKGDGMVVGGAPKVNFKISDFTENSLDGLGVLSAIAAKKGTVVQNNSWGFTTWGYRDLDNETKKQNARSTLEIWAGGLDVFQNTGVIVKTIPNNLKKNDSRFDGADVGSALPLLFDGKNSAIDLTEAFITVANVERVDYNNGDVKYARISEQCAETAEFCISGDGYGLRGLKGDSNTSLWDKVIGTSFAAPQVSAGVVLVAQAFPNQTPAQWTNRILCSANNKFVGIIGSAGSSNTTKYGQRNCGNGVTHDFSWDFGHGILDVYAALQPINSENFQSSLYSGSSSVFTSPNRFELSKSNITSSGIMGDALTTNLENVNNKFFDALGGGFDYSVSNDVLKSSVSTSSLNYESVFNSLSRISKSTRINKNKSKEFSGSIIDRSDIDKRQRFITTMDKPLPSTQKLMKNVNNDLSTYSTFGSSFLSSNSGGLGISYIKENKNNRFYFGISEPFEASDGESDRQYGENRDIAFGVDFLNNKNTEISTVLGISSEEDKLLGMEGSGAYNLNGSKSVTNYFGTNISSDFKDVNIYGQFILGDTNLSKPSDSIITGASNVTSTSFVSGISKYNIINDDRLTFQITQPPKVEDGSLTLDVISDYDSEGNLTHENVKVDLKPTGRQLDYSMSYDFNINDIASFKYKGIFIQDPGHNKSSKSIISNFIGFKYENHKFGAGISNEEDNNKPRFSYNFLLNKIDTNESLKFDLDLNPNNEDNINAKINYIFKF